MRKIIHHDQVDFIPQMQYWFNMSKLVNVIQHGNRIKGRNQQLSQETRKKVFDKVKYSFII